MGKSNAPFRHIKVLLGEFLLRIREKEIRLTRDLVAGDLNISVRTLNNLENSSGTSGDLILRVFHYYVFSGYLTAAEKRLFFYMFDRMRRCD